MRQTQKNLESVIAVWQCHDAFYRLIEKLDLLIYSGHSSDGIFEVRLKNQQAFPRAGREELSGRVFDEVWKGHSLDYASCTRPVNLTRFQTETRPAGVDLGEKLT